VDILFSLLTPSLVEYCEQRHMLSKYRCLLDKSKVAAVLTLNKILVTLHVVQRRITTKSLGFLFENTKPSILQDVSLSIIVKTSINGGNELN
jgi:hypothetical protein